MRRAVPVIVLSAVALMLGVPRGAQAQWAVVDVGAIAQLVKEVETLREQLSNAQQQLIQAQQQYQSMTGGRGMQNLLSGITRNYLPASWDQLPTALAAPLGAQVNGNAVLTAAQVAALSPAEQQQLTSARTNAALLSVATQQAYATASSRFASIQQLIAAIPAATDQKGILDLQARIQAEQGMLANESTKLSVLYQAAQAQEWAREQAGREQAIAGIGNLRTQPTLRLP
ncbi:MAG TPA: type IV secretion system protein [Steroidobacteraceae bacterium]|nr:type IV secretion system protein [Steroidobacteraceae bacterium]